MIFVDTGAWFSLAVKEDEDHAAALDFFKKNSEVLATSDLVAVETMNLLRFRHRGKKGLELACRVGDDIWDQRVARLIRVQPEDILSARRLFRRYRDKTFSFTDCTSFVLIERTRIKKAFAFDRHFDQFPGFERFP